MADGEDAAAARRRAAITDYRKKLLNCRELESRVGTGLSSRSRSPYPLTSPCSTPVSLGFGGADSRVSLGGSWLCARDLAGGLDVE